MLDFEAFWRYHIRSNPSSKVSKEAAYKQYTTHYSCNCISCEYRKEKGVMPVRQIKGCTAPLTQLVIVE